MPQLSDEVVRTTSSVPAMSGMPASDHYRLGESLNSTRRPTAAFAPSLIVSDLTGVALED
jgi:hypothetical protein